MTSREPTRPSILPIPSAMQRGSLTERPQFLKGDSRPSSHKEVKDQDEKSVDSASLDNQARRKLKNRHIQMIGIGGTIGTALFVQIGGTLVKGGPANLFLAFTIWCSFILAVSQCLAEMVSWMPISSPFVRFADHFVDPALGFCAGINFFVFETAMIPFEIVAFNVVLNFWTDKIPLAAVIFFVILTYAFLNLFAVKFYGESEFWLALGKAVLAVGLICFTFVTMVGGNPKKDAYGFRYWNPSKVPGTPFAEYVEEGNLGRFLGFLACLIQASFTIAGPDYVSMTAGEAQNPRKVLPKAFNSVFYRLTAFFVLGSLCVGIVVPYNDPDLIKAISDARPGAGSSPYVIAMQHMGIKVLPHIVNALILTAIYSAGNSYVYCASRTLYGLALEGKMPVFLTRCTKRGVPVFCVGITIAVSAVAFLQLSNNAAVVLTWFVNLVTASQLLNFATISFTYIRFHAALKSQGISRDSLPHKTGWQPYAAYYAFVGTFIMAFVGGYSVFLPGNWSIPTFLFSYAMIGVYPVLFIGWKVTHRTTWRDLKEIDFFKSERLEIDRYEESLNL